MKRNHTIHLMIVCTTLLITSCSNAPVQGKTEIIIIGTYHGNLYIMPNYHPDTLRYLLNISKPDVLALELREKDFNSQDYSRVPNDISEIVIPWATENSIPFAPIDWWTEEGIEERRAFFKTLRETEEGRETLANVPDENESHADKFDDFINMTVEYIHSHEFSEKTKKYWAELTDYFGEGPGNMRWNTRAAKMNDLLAGVIEKNPGKRIVVVTGAAHRYHFEDAVSQRDDVSLIPLSQFVDFNDLPEYAGNGHLEEFKRILSQLVQGPRANNNPDSIDVGYVHKLLDRYSTLTADQADQIPFIRYIDAECDYLSRDYESALEKFRSVAAHPEAGKIRCIRITVKEAAEYRIGNMLDLLGRREEAKQVYSSIADNPEHGALRIAEKYLNSPYKEHD